MATDAVIAADQEPPWSPWRAFALIESAEAQLLLGNHDRAVALLKETGAVAAALGSAGSIVLSRSELALLAMDHRQWGEAAEHVQIALATIDESQLHDYALSVLAFAATARLAVHQGDQQELDRQLARAMRTRPSCTVAIPYLAVRVRLQLATVYTAIGDRTTARHLLREIDDILLQRPALGSLVDEVAGLRTILTQTTPVTGATPLTAAELRLLPYLQTHLTFREIAQRLYISRNTVSTQVGSVYRKLGVSSRSDAVQHATTAGLLGG